MRKKLDTRFPASRIKKIMQADEDVGKIALPVPLLVSKALELFLQDLCDRTYEITLQRGAKTMSSLHLKHCVQRYSMFDFLRDSMSKVPDFGGSDSFGNERHPTRRRRIVSTDDDVETDSEGKRVKMGMEMPHHSGRGRGRGRGRPPRNSRLTENTNAKSHRFDDAFDHIDEHSASAADKLDNIETKENEVLATYDVGMSSSKTNTSFREVVAGGSSSSSMVLEPSHEEQHHLDWPRYEMTNINLEPAQLLLLNKKPELEEDYDNYEE